MVTDKELIKGIKADSDRVWKYLFSSPAEAVGRQVRPLLKGVRDVTFDDVFEEACIILMENVKAGKLDERETNLEGYLYVLCKRIALRYASAKKPLSMDSDRVELKDDGMEQSMGTPELEAEDAKEVELFLEKVLASMPSNQQAILRYFYWDRMSMSEIAALCGFKNENVAKSTKKRYMDNFRKRAEQMLRDDEAAEAAIERTIERAALRNQIGECRQLGKGLLSESACKDEIAPLSDGEIVNGIRNNSSQAWKALYARMYDTLKREISPLVD